MTKKKAPSELLKMGRPTKYLPEVIHAKIDDYLQSCGQEQAKLPSIAGLANYLGITKDTIYQWVKIYPDFSDYIKKVATQQEEILQSSGLFGGREINGSVAIFLLKALHQYKDTQDTQTLIQVNIKPILGQLDPE
jgi:hypothetical protein